LGRRPSGRGIARGRRGGAYRKEEAGGEGVVLEGEVEEVLQ